MICHLLLKSDQFKQKVRSVFIIYFHKFVMYDQKQKDKQVE